MARVTRFFFVAIPSCILIFIFRRKASTKMYHLIKLFCLPLLTLASGQLSAQSYTVDSIYFPEDDSLEAYLEEQGQAPASLKGLMRVAATEEYAGIGFGVDMEKDQALVWPTTSSKGDTLMLTRVGKYLYRKTSADGKRYQELHFGGPELVLETGENRPLEAPDEPGKDYRQLEEKYGNEFPANRVRLILKKSEGTGADITQSYRVTGLGLSVNDDVLDFGKEHVRMFMGYAATQEDMLEKQYVGSTFNINLQGKRIKLQITDPNGGSMNVGGSLKQVCREIYRLEVMNSYYDFYVDGSLEEGDFKVRAVLQSSFIPPDDDYLTLPAYRQLRSKYGPQLTYNTIAHQLKKLD